MVSYECIGYGQKKTVHSPSQCIKSKKIVSVIIPTYNEEGNIERIVRALETVLNATEVKGKYEIVIVDDASKDKTPHLMDKLAEKGDVIAVHRTGKKGIFSAIQDGISIANGEYVIMMDSDFSHPPSLIAEFLKYKDKYDIVSGSRFIRGGGMDAPFHRKYGSLLINQICAFIIGVNQKDIAGGFHLIRRDKFLEIKFRYPTVFGEFDFELFYRAKKKGLRVLEIPFVYRFREEGQSKMNNLSSYALGYFKQAFRLRFERN